ncbi:CoA-binding protein [Desulfosarcina alkanivorans]|uniref:CoA-binding protein n=1 Tax=Desulfosarcina alkanivorans TaxID=571177 RepID=A0A5K7YT12_9BACT|nr:acetate--CoA ligase family protein [Desulfosarcina alkanivorans]BBO67777.1 CoA-binding protein [Desulfosarcina alkanivorans]
MGLDPIILKQVEEIVRNAHEKGRDMLFEDEVYSVLAHLGMRVPAHVVVRKAGEISARLLSRLGSGKVVMKVMSPSVTHKQSEGGVRIVVKDPEFVRYTFDRMMAAFEEKGIPVEGILFVEYVEYSQDLGNEVLLGFRESEAFGPVISLSKGGTDAEHFARYFSPPNLIMAPIDRQWAQALLESTSIQKKYVAQGNTGYITHIVNAGVRLSDLAVVFSTYFRAGTDFVITEFEINPCVFTPDGSFIALDGFARFHKRTGSVPDLAVAPKEAVRPFFEPRGIAVVGVSTSDSGKMGNIIAANLLRLGRTDVHAVNPKGGTITLAGVTLPVVRSMAEIDGAVDLAIITVPAAATLPVVETCAEKGVRAVILIPGGFSEIKRNRDLEARILELSRQAGFRVIGPNCLGIVYAGHGGDPGINTFFIPEEKFSLNLEKENKVAILSQSGALGIIEIDNLKNAISPKVIVSYGNQLDIDPCDLIAYFQNEPLVNVIGCYIEGFKPWAGRKFFNIVAESSKPVIVYKAGRTPAGRKATESHTASIAGEYAVARAAMKQAGAIVADTMIDHGDFIKTFALLHDFAVHGNRVAIIANAGYEKTYAADNLGDLRLADFDEKTMAALKAVMPPMVEPDPLLDLTPMADDEIFERAVETVLQSASVDVLVISIVPQSTLIHTTDEEIRNNPDNIAARIIRMVHRYKKPTLVSVCVASRADAVYNELGRTFDAGGVPTYLTANRAMLCLNAFVRYRLMRQTCSLGDWLR